MKKHLFFPLILLGITALAYGLQIHRLGFYWDDWVFLYRFSRLGIMDTIWYGPTRQLAIFMQAPGFLFAADSPLRWHIYMLFLRWATALIFAWLLNLIWPDKRKATALMALLFAVHPAFTQNSIAVVYSVQIFGYGIYLLSLGLMVSAIKQPGRFWWFSLASLLTQAFHLFSGEYYFGLELIRPILLWVALAGDPSRLVKTIRYSTLYAALLAFYLAWRFGIFTTGQFATYDYKTLTAAYAKDGSEAVVYLLRYALQDVLQLLVNTWPSTLSPSLIDFSKPYNLFSLLAAALVAGGLFLAFTRFWPAQQGPAATGRFFQESLLIGFGAVLAGFIPGWFVLRFIVMPGNYGDRFALPGLMGASILLIALIEYLANSDRNRNILIASILIGLSVGHQMRATNNYRWDWERQLRTYWQTYWRAPALQPGTVLVGGNAISTTTINYVGAFAYNFVYPSSQAYDQPPVWFVNYYKTPIPENYQSFTQGQQEFFDRQANIEIRLSPEKLLTIHYDSEACLRLYEPGALDLYDLVEGYRPAVAVSNPGLIVREPVSAPLAHIFGQEPRQTWCYFYQKADLARQFADWAQILSLETEANRLNLQPRNDFERLPFIEAHARSGDWQSALQASLETYQSTRRTRTALCALWHSFENPDPQTSEALFSQLSCQP